MSTNIDYCVECGAEHGYMCGPCDHCGCRVFSRTPIHDDPLGPVTDEPALMLVGVQIGSQRGQ